RVDFPAPEGPNKIVMPGGASAETSRRKDAVSGRCLRMLATRLDEFTSRAIATTQASTRGDSQRTRGTAPRRRWRGEAMRADWLHRIQEPPRGRKFRWRRCASRLQDFHRP